MTDWLARLPPSCIGYRPCGCGALARSHDHCKCGAPKEAHQVAAPAVAERRATQNYAEVAQDKSTDEGKSEDGRTMPREAQGTEPERLTRPGVASETVPSAPISDPAPPGGVETPPPADQLLKQLVMSYDQDDSMEFLEALVLGRQYLGLKLADEHEDRKDREVLHANKMATTLDEFKARGAVAPPAPEPPQGWQVRLRNAVTGVVLKCVADDSLHPDRVFVSEGTYECEVTPLAAPPSPSPAPPEERT